MTARRWISGILASLLIAGCSHPTYFRQPLTPPGEAEIDGRLVGDWIGRSGKDVLLALSIRPDTDGEAGRLVVTAMMAVNNRIGEEGGAGWFTRVAYPSMIDGETYYNIRTEGPGHQFAAIDAQGNLTSDPEDADWFITPGHADREYWIAKPVFDDDGRLWLRFIAVNLWHAVEKRDAPDALRQSLGIRGQGESYWIESCGSDCSYARADMAPEILIGLIRTYRTEDVFALRAGPFVRTDDVLPRYAYDLK